MAEILIIDDDVAFCKMLEDLVLRLGHQSRICHCLGDCRKELSNGSFDLVLLDVGLPDGNGLDILPWIRQLSFAPEVIIITGEGDQDGAELAVHNGAWDYLVKTAVFEQINLTITRAIDHHRTIMALRALKTIDRCGIVGQSPTIRRSLDLLGQAAMNDFNLLITGETGTGKELFARAIHANSARAGRRMVVVDCAALPETLVESVLFGHVKGAFTGADKDMPGLFQASDGSTLFMDEVGELPMNLQRIFLRVLQEKSFSPVGGGREISSNFRLISATNKDLDQLAAQGKFRRDLLFRLRAMSIHLPPLRERMEDLPLLTGHILEKISHPVPQLSPGFIRALANHSWPGNIRELNHVLQGATASAMGRAQLIVQHLPPKFRAMAVRQSLENNPDRRSPACVTVQDQTGNEQRHLTSIRKHRKAQDKKYLEHLILEFKGDMQSAAQKAGLSLSRLYGLLREHGLK